MAIGIESVIGPEKAIGYAITALNIFPGLGTAVAFVLGKIMKDPGWQGNNPQTQQHFFQEVATPTIAAAKNYDFSPAALALALHNGPPYYEHFGGAVSRWPTVAPAFYAIIIGNAIATGDWSKADQFFAWLDDVAEDGRVYLEDQARVRAIVDQYGDQFASQGD